MPSSFSIVVGEPTIQTVLRPIWMITRSYAKHRGFVQKAFEWERSGEYLIWRVSYVIECAGIKLKKIRDMERGPTSYITIAKA